jgi:AbiV family abortive infection protein
VERKGIDPKVVMQFGIAAAANALAIAEEATLLAKEGHDARAFSLSVLAVEELSKAWVALVAGLFPNDPDVGSELRAMLKGHHRVKLDASLFLERDFPKVVGMEPDAMARELDGVLSEDVYARKNAGLYVDLEEDQVLGPERIGPEEVALGKKLRKMVVAWGVILEGTLERDLEDRGEG